MNMESNGGQSKKNWDSKSKRKKKQRKNKKKRKRKKKKTMEINKTTEEQEIWDNKKEAARLEEAKISIRAIP